MDVNGQLHAQAVSALVKEQQYSLDSRLSGPQSRSGRGAEEIFSAGFRTSFVQPIASHFTD
jgi:hypothetical protein